jgi:hypothetical protein
MLSLLLRNAGVQRTLSHPSVDGLSLFGLSLLNQRHVCLVQGFIRGQLPGVLV